MAVVAAGWRRPRALQLPAWPGEVSTLACALALGLVALLVVCPVALLVVNSFQVGAFGTPTTWGVGNWVAAFTQPDLAGALGNTVSLALVREGVGMLAGILLAWLIARTDLPGRNWLEFGFWVAVFLPVLTVTLSWIMVFDGHNGLANQLLQRLPFVSGPVFEIYSWWGIVAAHLLSTTIAVKVMLLTPAFRNLDAALEEVARTSGAGRLVTMTRVVLPVLAPAVLVVALLGTIRAFESFETELILGAPPRIEIFSTKIYHIALRLPPEYGVATALSMVILAMLTPLILLQQWFSARRSYVTVTSKFRPALQRLGAWRWPLFGMTLLWVLITTAVPVALVLIGTFMSIFGHFDVRDPWTLRNWKTVLGSPTFLHALGNTLVIGFGEALLAMAAFTLLAYIIVRSRFAGRGALDFLVWLPSAVPGIILGLGYLWLFLGTPFLRPLYGTTFILILVAALGTMTLTTQVTKASLLQLGAELEEAARMNGAPWLYTFRRVVLPLIAPAIAVVGVLGFASAVRTTGAIALLSTRANQPLSMLQLNLLADNQFEAASVVGVFLLVLTVGVALAARVLGLRLGIAAR